MLQSSLNLKRLIVSLSSTKATCHQHMLTASEGTHPGAGSTRTIKDGSGDSDVSSVLSPIRSQNSCLSPISRCGLLAFLPVQSVKLVFPNIGFSSEFGKYLGIQTNSSKTSHPLPRRELVPPRAGACAANLLNRNLTFEVSRHPNQSTSQNQNDGAA